MATIAITNMTCGGCAKGVQAVLREAAPGASVTIDLERREVTVVANDAAPLITALRAAGWEAAPAG